MVILNKPYPYLFTLKRNLIVASSVGLLSIYLNQIRLNDSFFYNNTILSPNIISIISGVLVGLSLFLVIHIIPYLFISNYRKDNWNIGNEFVLSIGVFFVVFIFNYSFFIIITKDASKLLSFTFFLKLLGYVITTGVGVFSAVLWINYTITLKKNLKNVQQLNIQLSNSQKDTNTVDVKNNNRVVIPTIIKNEVIEFVIDDLVCIKSNGNYIEIFLKGNNGVKMYLYRATIQELDEKLSEYDFIIKTHRSYIVNIHYIIKAEGNARNYQLYIDGIEEAIPVARGRFKEFNALFDNVKA